MIRYQVDTEAEAVQAITNDKRYRPFLLAGRWYLAKTSEDIYTAYATKNSAIKNTLTGSYLVIS